MTTHSSTWGDKNTKFFFELTPERILSVIEGAELEGSKLECTGRCLQLNSLENRVYEIEIECDDPKTPSDRFRVVKFYRPGRWSKEQILDEHQFLADLKSNDIPVVCPIKFADGSTLKTVDEIDIHFAIFPKQGGRSPDELLNEQLPQVGRLIARLHNIGAMKDAEHRIELSPEVYALQNLDSLLDLKIIPSAFESNYQRIVENIYDICAPWFDEVDYQRIHGDCHLGNILWGNEGAFLVDFDDMVIGPCVQDIWLLVQGRDEESLKRRDDLLAGYQQMRQFDYSSLRLIEPLRAMRMVHFSAWIANRWSDPIFPKTFVEFGTDKYWQEELQSLMEILEIMQGANSY